MTAPRQINGIFDFGAVAATTGLRKGVAARFSAADAISRLSTARAAGFGVQLEEGTLPDGSANYGAAATTPAEPVTLQTLGIAAVLVPGSSSGTINDQIVCDANGQFVTSTPYSLSRYVWGRFIETFTAGSDAEYRAAHLQQQVVEVVRPITVSQPLKTTVLGAATVFGTGPGLAFSAAAVALYVARFTGETIRNLSVSLTTAPGGADTVIVAVMKSSDNGATYSATAVTCTISAAAKAATDLVNTASLTAGDIVAVRAISSAGTAAGCAISFDIT